MHGHTTDRLVSAAKGVVSGLRVCALRHKIGALAAALAITVSLVIGSQAAGAQANVYIVQAGDTLTGVALGIYGNAALWPTLYQANRELIGGDPNLIIPGQRLLVPQAVSGQGVVQVAQTTQYYTVREGDTLNLLALKVYGSGDLWPAIYEANRSLIGNPNSIVAGQVLAIPPLSQQQVRQFTTQLVSLRQPVLVQQTYTLVAGDTLVGLSERFYGTWAYWPTIYALNRAALGPNPDSPPVGALIALPVLASLPQIALRPQVIYVDRPIYVSRPAAVQPQTPPSAQPDGPLLILPSPAGQVNTASSELVVQPAPIQGPAELQLPSADAGRSVFAAGAGARIYTVQQGDTLVTIARALYGDPARWPHIYSANLETIGANPAAVPVGATLSIPD